ncbi:protein toll-like [Chironomus tepperi]|uniref:protein toll-like n=1 Tax=Chironomus tepperi TaxID=113505 RepID=UPI00391F4189
MTSLRELTVLLLLATAVQSSKLLKCPTSDNKCYCSEFGELEIQCPKFDPRIIVRIQPNNFLSFDCENSTDSDYDLVPEIELPEAQMIKITRCPLPHGRSLSTYFKNIHVEKILWLQIFSGGVNSRHPLESSHLRGFEDITRFLISGNENEFRDLPSDLFASMRKLTWITMRVGNIQLPVELFAPLTNLEFLELGHNKMSTLEPGLLRNNNKLQQLNLWGNNLRNLNKDAFNGLENLRELDLSTNGMESLEPDLFIYLTNLTHLNLGGNNFASLPEGLFANNRKLTIFKMLENRVPMDTLPEGFLANQTMLADVFIKCELRKIPEDIFEESINIANIRLDGNQLEVLPKYLFKDQRQLSTLDLSDNYLTDLPEELFEGTPELKKLYLSHNRIEDIPEHIFQPLRKLTELHINNNFIVSLHANVFQNIESVRVINLENNRLTFENVFASIDVHNESYTETYVVASRFQKLQNLEDLNLKNNSIKTIFEDFTLTNLKRLDLSYNNITILSKTDLQFTSKRELTIDLRHNNIETVYFNHYINDENPTQMVVYLEHNPIICNCQILDFVKYIKNPELIKKTGIEIELGDLNCTKPEKMRGRSIVDVKPLELTCPFDDPSSNMEKRCPETCSSCDVRLDDRTLLLDCYANLSISSLPNAANSSLQNVELKIEGQGLTEIPSSASVGYKQITKLFLADNEIRSIGELPPKLVELELQNNQIEVLNDTTIMSLNYSTTLKSMKLSGNPWRCDCSNLAFINFVQKSYTKILDYSEMTCRTGEFVNTLTASGLCSEDNFIVVLACIILAVFSIIVGTCAALYYKYQKQIKMWLYSHNLFLWFVTEEELDKDKSYDAFVSYAHQDADFVTDHLVPQLEKCVVPYKLCFHERDFLPGLEISTQISNSINESKRTIVVMSPHYLASNWGQWEFRVAQSQAATEKRSRIIVILYGDIGDINKLEPETRDYLKLNTYVKWGDKWFWEKLRYAMPHVKGQGPLDKSKGLVKTSIKSSVDDKLELIKPISVTPPQLTTPPAEQIANPLIAKLNAKNAAKNHQNSNGYNGNGHVNTAYVINTSSRQSDV